MRRPPRPRALPCRLLRGAPARPTLRWSAGRSRRDDVPKPCVVLGHWPRLRCDGSARAARPRPRARLWPLRGQDHRRWLGWHCLRPRGRDGPSRGQLPKASRSVQSAFGPLALRRLWLIQRSRRLRPRRGELAGRLRPAFQPQVERPKAGGAIDSGCRSARARCSGGSPHAAPPRLVIHSVTAQISPSPGARALRWILGRADTRGARCTDKTDNLISRLVHMCCRRFRPL
mmetsp:Transcript_81005/g.161035  ORF Transcript_81005/g.161035 Transcript_81005/m.161035 type:complete len:230 (+) Transcript_81005:1158-1847(+)